MTESVLMNIKERTRSETIFKILTFGLPVAAVIAACVISLLSKVTIPVEHPMILVLASVLILVPSKLINIKTLQKITAFYLFGVAVNLLSAQYFSLAFLSLNIKVSCTSIPLLLCAAGYFMRKSGTNNTADDSEKTDIIIAWLLALAVVVVHAIFLSLTVYNFYGYGYERNLSTTGNIILYLLLFIVLWPILGNLRFRQVTGLIMTIFYTVSMLINRQL